MARLPDSMKTQQTYPRHILPQLREALSYAPVVLIHGSRQCGKSTLARMVGEPYEYVSFDDLNVLRTAQGDPVGFVAGLSDRVILDEIQRVPELFVTIKHAVDTRRQPGRFILTGSANVLLLPRLSDSLAGRMTTIQLLPLSQCEIAGHRSAFLSRMFSNDFTGFKGVRQGTRLGPRVMSGGYPAPLVQVPEKNRNRWYREYIRSVVDRDVSDMSRILEADALPRLLTMLANGTAQLVNINELSKSFQLSRPTVDHYVGLLRRLFLVEFLQPWFANRNSRLVKTPKAHISDTGLAGAILRVKPDVQAGDPALFGHLFESFVYMELRKLASWHDEDLDFFHYRDRDDYEVDMVIEHGSNAVAGVEVKSGATIREQDFAGLRRLQRQLGKKLKCGILLYDGERVLPFGDRMIAVPITALWSA
jgi:uncharacterized protein